MLTGKRAAATFGRMSIQFLCPSCRHPIEVDDEWSNQPVACPYCRNTVTAPEVSTYATTSPPPTARAIEYPAPLDPEQLAVAPPPPGRNLVAVWSLALAVGWFVLWIVAQASLAPHLEEALGPDVTQQSFQSFFRERLDSGALPQWLVTGILVMGVSLASWVAGLVCAILGVRSRHRRGLAMAALAILALLPLMTCAGLVLS